jgi:hypothetical protein
VLLACAGDQELRLSSGKLDGLVWHSRLSDFSALRPSYPTGSRHICNGCLLRSSLRGQNPQQVQTIPSGNASAVAPMVSTTPPKEDNVDTSSAEAPAAQALVARSKSKVLDDNLVDDDPDPLNFDATGSKIIYRMSSRLQRCWPDSGKLNCPIWHSE